MDLSPEKKKSFIQQLQNQSEKKRNFISKQIKINNANKDEDEQEEAIDDTNDDEKSTQDVASIEIEIETNKLNILENIDPVGEMQEAQKKKIEQKEKIRRKTNFKFR